MKRALLLLMAGVAAPTLAQAPQAPVVVRSPEVDADHRVTFRFRAPQAKSVLLAREGAEPLPMLAGEQGVWTVTTPPLEPDFYGYSFVADGASLIDPVNPLLKPNLISTQSMVHVPGPASLPWETGDVPRGMLHRHFYRSGVVGDDRDYYVYTPPGYDGAAKTSYPVLYLLHGFSDDARGWTDVGRAHVILDNLIARGKARPMLVVMPLGYGALEMLAGWGAIRNADLRRRSYDRFRDALFAEVAPAVEKNYRVARGRSSTAVAGLSMGGAQSFYIGLNARERFGWIGAFSTGGMVSDDYGSIFPTLDEKAGAELHLLWIACGTEDRLIDSNRQFREWLKGRNVRHETIETPGGHTWMVWRRNLAEFVPRLFQPR